MTQAVALKRIYNEIRRELRRRPAQARSPASIRSSPSRTPTLTWRPSRRPSKRAKGDTARPERATPWEFGGPQDFAHLEGVTVNSYTELGATGADSERDHYIDELFPLAAKEITYADVLGQSSIHVDKLVNAAPEEKAQRSLCARAGA